VTVSLDKVSNIHQWKELIQLPQVNHIATYLPHMAHLFYFVVRCYEEQMFLILYRLLLINAIRNSSFSVKPPASCRCIVISGLDNMSFCWLFCDVSSQNKVAVSFSTPSYFSSQVERGSFYFNFKKCIIISRLSYIAPLEFYSSIL
jgi:hypothetical protein